MAPKKNQAKKNQPKTKAKSSQPASSSAQVKSNTPAIAGSAAAVSTMKPINISSQNVSGECKLKCDYSFNYNSVSNPTATNFGTYIQITYNDNPSVTYNNIQYKVSSINIYSPSLHYYNGGYVTGEICITHAPLYGGNSLMVYIPISVYGITVSGSIIINNIIKAVSTMAPSAGQNTNKGTGTFTLNDVVPKKSFYTYTSGSRDVIVYGFSDAIGITNDSLSTLQKIIKQVTSNPAVVSVPIYVNNGGPSMSASLSNLTMDCQALDIGEPMEEYVKQKSSNNLDFMGSDGMLYFLIIIIIVTVFVLAYFLKKYFINTFDVNSVK
jgi:carbonic anhydrase